MSRGPGGVSRPTAGTLRGLEALAAPVGQLGSPAVLADEGELRMWIHGREPGSRRFSIYEVQNLGREVEAAP